MGPRNRRIGLTRVELTPQFLHFALKKASSLPQAAEFLVGCLEIATSYSRLVARCLQLVLKLSDSVQLRAVRSSPAQHACHAAGGLSGQCQLLLKLLNLLL
eukprot:scaffold27764_cov40-Prasinocladus_malaysianus.AAC.2